jgi:hypothetical protein
MRSVPSSEHSTADDAPVLSAIVPFGALIFDRDTRAVAEEYLYSSVVAEFLARENPIPPVWCETAGQHRYKVVVQDENLFNFAAAFLRDREHIPIVMLSPDNPHSS